MDRNSARTALDTAARKRVEAKDAYDAADEELRQAIRDADAVGVSHVEIARRAEVHRNTVARVVGDTGRRDPGPVVDQ